MRDGHDDLSLPLFVVVPPQLPIPLVAGGSGLEVIETGGSVNTENMHVWHVFCAGGKEHVSEIKK